MADHFIHLCKQVTRESIIHSCFKCTFITFRLLPFYYYCSSWRWWWCFCLLLLIFFSFVRYIFAPVVYSCLLFVKCLFGKNGRYENVNNNILLVFSVFFCCFRHVYYHNNHKNCQQIQQRKNIQQIFVLHWISHFTFHSFCALWYFSCLTGKRSQEIRKVNKFVRPMTLYYILVLKF